ncbi:hypothetical protein D3C73_921500 [compost metagenome]
MHAAIGLLGHDAEQQRLGQAALLPFRPHHRAQVLVVLVGGHQRRAHVGQPAADAGLHGRVVLDHVVEGMALVVEQRCRAGRLGHVGSQRADMVRVGFQAVAGFIGHVIIGGSIGIVLEQPLVGRQHVAHLAALLLHALADDIFHVLQRGIGLVAPLRIGVGHQQHGIAVALLGSRHALLQCIHLHLVPGRNPLCVGLRRQGNQASQGQQRPGTGNQDRNGHWWHCV